MGIIFKFRWSLLFPSFQSCKSKDPSTFPESPVPIHPTFINLHLPPPTILPTSPASPRLAYAADDEDSRSPPPPPPPPPEHFHWIKEDDWHIVEDKDPSPKKKKKVNKKQSKSKQRTRTSITSSPDSEWFSSDEPSETIVSSSRTLSTDSCSSAIDGHDAPVRGPMRRKGRNSARRVRTRRVKCVGPKTGLVGDVSPAGVPAPESVSPARLSRFGPMLACGIEGKVRESFAVVKKSVEPFEDFKRSMAEMILEKEMVEVGELEQLLQCFLSLNSKDHHGIIVEAFAEIYEAMFSESRLREI